MYIILLPNCESKQRLNLSNKTNTCPFRWGGIDVEQGNSVNISKIWATAQGRIDLTGRSCEEQVTRLVVPKE